MRDLVSGIDVLVVAIMLFVVYLSSRRIQERNSERFAYYSHLTRALFVRIFSGLVFVCVYIFYYDGGDTQYYFTGTRCIVRMAGKDFGAFVQLMLGDRSMELRSLFDGYTGWPTYFKDANSWAVCRFSVPFYLLGCGSYLGMTIVMDALLFIPIWRFYRMLVHVYPKCTKIFAFALFYVPSVCFWGSGLLKDIWCMVGVFAIYNACWFIFKRKRFIYSNIFRYIFWAYVLIQIRPYTFYTVFATSIIWIGLIELRVIESKFISVAFFPFVAVLISLVFVVFIDNVSDYAEGKYATVGSMMEQAVVIQDDLKRDYYGDNSFDIGSFEATPTGLLAKAPQALLAGLFRPFVWEARSPFMLISGLENLALLLLTMYVAFKMRMRCVRELVNDPLMANFALFVIVFAFFIGLTIANFGALVRYRIILQPFFTIVLFRLFFIYRQEDREEDEESL